MYKRRNILHAIKVFYVYFMTLMLPFLPPSAHTKLYIFSYFLILFFCILQYFWIYNIYARLMECSWRDKNFFLFFLQHFCLPSHLLHKKCQEWRGKVLSEENFLPRKNWMKISAVIIGSLALSMIYIVTMEGISKLLRDINDCWIEEEIWENIFYFFLKNSAFFEFYGWLILWNVCHVKNLLDGIWSVRNQELILTSFVSYLDLDALIRIFM